MLKTENDFRSAAKKAVAEYWNESKTLSKKFGEISAKRVYVVWQVKVLQNFKALLAVDADGDNMYFEATYNGDGSVMYLDAYRKAANREIKC
ncbi:MAG: hypothetical protein IJ241_08420 [Clostridia bacterium]|nr:hypothetical protein [Clostridia bacterium]